MSMNWTAFEDSVSVFMDKYHVPGLAVAVSMEGRVIYKRGFGLRNLKTGDSVTPETIFGTASVTKSFTAAAIIDLEKQGKLSLIDPISEFLPELSLPDFINIHDVKIHHLLSHTSGLPPLKRREDLNQLEEHLEYLSNLNIEPLGQPGEYLSYSNDAFLLLGLIIERVTGKLYRRYITKHFLDTLNMNRSTFSLEELHKFNNVTEPYIYDKKANHYKLAVWSRLGNYEVGGGIRSTVMDLLKYGQIYLETNKYSKMWEPIYKYSSHNYYGYGLQIVPDYEEVTLVRHSGGQPGVSSHFGFIPEKDVVIAVLSNLSDVPISDIWQGAANTVLNLPINTTTEIGNLLEVTDSDIERFSGIYSSDEGDYIQIKKENNKLIISTEDDSYILKRLDDETLVIEEGRYPLKFYTKNGQVWSVLFGLRILRKKPVETYIAAN